MKYNYVRATIILGVGLAATSTLYAADEKQGSFADFLKRDSGAFEDFRSGKSRTEQPKQPERRVVYSKQVDSVPQVSPQRLRASELYDAYCQISDRLDNSDPKRGYNKRIADLRAKLFPTDRGWYDQAYWSEKDWAVNWPFLQDLEARAAQHRATLKQLAATWKAEGFERIFHLSLDECYGRKAAYIYLDREDQSVFPSPIRTNMVDYVYFQMDSLWPTNGSTSVTSLTAPTDSRIIHRTPPPPVPEQPETEPIDETIQEENVVPVKPWDEMTPEERHRALLENSPEAWAGFQRDIFGDDTNGQARAKATLICSNVTAVTTNIAIANLPPPKPLPVLKPWDQMTEQERHDALKANRCEAWDAVRDALLSGDRDQIDAVLAALSGKPAINDAVRAVAYWNGYYQGQMEAATHADQSPIDTVVAAYKIPELMALVREGYNDGKAGRPQKYAMPAPADLQKLAPAQP